MEVPLFKESSPALKIFWLRALYYKCNASSVQKVNKSISWMKNVV